MPSLGHNHHQYDSSNNEPENGTMWIDKYAPIRSEDLCIQPKKVSEVREWITSFFPSVHCNQKPSEQNCSYNVSPKNDGPKLIILVGSPGIGKSSMCRVLANELGLSLIEWNNITTNFSSSSQYVSQVASFEEFLTNAAGFRSLIMSASKGTPLSRHSSLKKQPYVEKKRSKGNLILIEELPNAQSETMKERLRTIMSNHISRSVYPTLLIFSDVSEGKAAPSDLESIIPPSILYSTTVRIMQCNDVTQTRSKKILDKILQKEGCSVSAKAMEQIYASSGGDLRSAIMTLQFQQSSRRLIKRHKGGTKPEFRKDSKLSPFHALGKILYAKREVAIPTFQKRKAFFSCGTKNETSDPIKVSEGGSKKWIKWVDKRPPLSFDPDTVLNNSDMGFDASLYFLAHHTPDFFTDINELSDTFETYSDSAFLMHEGKFTSDRENVGVASPLQYAVSLAGRAVAISNKHPSPKRFRSLNAPSYFEVLKKRKENNTRILHISKRLSCDFTVGCSKQTITERLPFIKLISSEVKFSLSNLHSMAKTSDEFPLPSVDSHNVAQLLKEQQRILESDDIQEYD